MTREELPHTRYRAWIDNPPDYFESRTRAERLATVKSAIVRLKREIERAEETVIAEQDKPRSNEARIAKNNATSTLRDRLAELQAEESELEVLIGFEGRHKTYAQIATYLYRYVYSEGF